jgi:hypothetical protein
VELNILGISSLYKRSEMNPSRKRRDYNWLYRRRLQEHGERAWICVHEELYHPELHDNDCSEYPRSFLGPRAKPRRLLGERPAG